MSSRVHSSTSMLQRGLLAVLACAAFASIGCAENAILDVQLNLPPAGRFYDFSAPEAEQDWVEYSHAEVQIGTLQQFSSQGDLRSAFDIQWTTIETVEGDLSVALTESPKEFNLSIETNDPSEDLLMQVRFCTRPDCADLDMKNRTVKFFVERPFFIGKPSKVSWLNNPELDIAAIPHTCEEDAIETADGVEPGTCDGECTDEDSSGTCIPLNCCQLEVTSTQLTVPPDLRDPEVNAIVLPQDRNEEQAVDACAVQRVGDGLGWFCGIERCAVKGCGTGGNFCGRDGIHFCD